MIENDLNHYLPQASDFFSVFVYSCIMGLAIIAVIWTIYHYFILKKHERP